MNDEKSIPVIPEREEPIITDTAQFSQEALNEHADVKGEDE